MKRQFLLVFSMLLTIVLQAQNNQYINIKGSIDQLNIDKLMDSNPETACSINFQEKKEHYLFFFLKNGENIDGISLDVKGCSAEQLKNILRVQVTVDPMNYGSYIGYELQKTDSYSLKFNPNYGMYVVLSFQPDVVKKIQINNVRFQLWKTEKDEKQCLVENKPWLNQSLGIEDRINSLLSVMTPLEKISLLHESYGIKGSEKYGIPHINKVEALHGYSAGSGATLFPQAIAMGATWNKELIEETARVIGTETFDAGVSQAWSPVLDVAQDPRWGRCEETYGEDPVLVGMIGNAWIKGFQSAGPIVTLKHFAGHGAILGGRDSNDPGISEREMREIHLPPFRYIIKNNPIEQVMNAYSNYLGIPVAKSEELLVHILREEYGFDGNIVSDCGSIRNLTAYKHYVVPDTLGAAHWGLKVQIGTNCGSVYAAPQVMKAAEEGKLNMEDLNKTCANLLRMYFRQGWMDGKKDEIFDFNAKYPSWNTPEHKKVAYQVAAESIVLLENKNNILPLSSNLKSIAVIGPGADDMQVGDYSPDPAKYEMKSVLKGILKNTGQNTQVFYEKACHFIETENNNIDKAVKLSQACDVTILVLGDLSTTEHYQIPKTSGENFDLATLILPGLQQQLLERICAEKKPVILVLQSGRPYNLSFAKENCKAILVNWLAGQEGGDATADVLFGKINPSGKLPMTFPRHVGQVPCYYNVKPSGRRYNYVDDPGTPLFRFGYGKSYTDFTYKNLKATENSDGTISVSAKVENTGKTEGAEVVQLYVTDMYSSASTRIMELKDFTKVNLRAGETKTVNFTLTPYQISLLNEKMDRVVESGDFKIHVGSVSPKHPVDKRVKDLVNFDNPKEGLSKTIHYSKNYSADFEIKHIRTYTDSQTNQKLTDIEVKNVGSLTDAGFVNLFIDGVKSDEKHHYELDPGKTKQITFKINDAGRELIFTSKYKQINISNNQ